MSYYALQMRGGQAVPRSGNAGVPGWVPPIGIPTPTFGIAETAPAAPDPWTSEVPGKYYINYETGTDTPTYGTPTAPRKHLPYGTEHLAAGAYVEIHGTYDFYHGSPWIIHPDGTRANPVWIRGVDTGANRPLCRQGWTITGTYFVIENIAFGPLDTTDPGRVSFTAPVSYGVLRHCEVSGTPAGGGASIVSYDASTVDHVLHWDNYVHDNGDPASAADQDAHGLSITANVSQVWIVDCEFARNGGDGCQINAASAADQATLHHIYFGRNHCHGNRQGGFWAKQSVDVIVSQNVIHGGRENSGGAGGGIGFQYNPERVWFLCNHIYDGTYGAYCGGGSGLGSGTICYFIGNLIHDCHWRALRIDGVTESFAYNADTSYAQAGLMIAGGLDAVVVGNTIYDVDAGINSPTTATFTIAENIIANVTDAAANHIWLEIPATADAVTLHHNVFGGTVRLRTGTGGSMTLAAYQAAYPGKGADCVAADPLFVNPGAGDFQLQSGSPAVNAGALEAVYATFFSLYGLDITKDLAGVGRPQGAAWDIGAYERVGS